MMKTLMSGRTRGHRGTSAPFQVSDKCQKNKSRGKEREKRETRNEKGEGTITTDKGEKRKEIRREDIQA